MEKATIRVVTTKKGQKRVVVQVGEQVIWLNYGLVKYVVEKEENNNE